MMVSVTLPFRTKATNAGGVKAGAFWAYVRAAKAMRKGTAMAVRAHLPGPPPFPLTVRFVRLSPGRLDSEDNLRAAMKHIKDGVADALDLKTDRCPELVTWLYHEETSGRTHAVRIEIRRREGDNSA